MPSLQKAESIWKGLALEEGVHGRTVDEMPIDKRCGRESHVDIWGERVLGKRKTKSRTGRQKLSGHVIGT